MSICDLISRSRSQAQAKNDIHNIVDMYQLFNLERDTLIQFLAPTLSNVSHNKIPNNFSNPKLQLFNCIYWHMLTKNKHLSSWYCEQLYKM